MPALIPELEQTFNFNQAHEGPVDASTPCNPTASGTGHRRENRRLSGFRQAQLAAILEGRENAGSSKEAPRKRTEEGGQVLRGASKRRRSPSVPRRKSPRLVKQVEGGGNFEKEGCQMTLHKEPVAEMGSKPIEVSAGVKVSYPQDSLQCAKCQFKAKTKHGFEKHSCKKHMGSKKKDGKVAEADIGAQSKAGEEVGTTVDDQHSSSGARNKGGTVSQEENESVPTSKSSTGATVTQVKTALGTVRKKSNCGTLGAPVSQEKKDLGGVPTLNRLNTSRASARRSRSLCASMLKE